MSQFDLYYLYEIYDFTSFLTREALLFSRIKYISSFLFWRMVGPATLSLLSLPALALLSWWKTGMSCCHIRVLSLERHCSSLDLLNMNEAIKLRMAILSPSLLKKFLYLFSFRWIDAYLPYLISISGIISLAIILIPLLVIGWLRTSKKVSFFFG